jgi:hypothetical protein
MWCARFERSGEMATLVVETLPRELNTCRGIQGTHRNTHKCLDSLISQEFVDVHKLVCEGGMCHTPENDRGRERERESRTAH